MDRKTKERGRGGGGGEGCGVLVNTRQYVRRYGYGCLVHVRAAKRCRVGEQKGPKARKRRKTKTKTEQVARSSPN